jgi:hypothetical protein
VTPERIQIPEGRTSPARRCLWLLPVLAILCCDQSGSAKRAEVRSVATAIDRLRQAANPDKAPKLVELSKLPCSVPDVCQLRDLCVRAYEQQVEALDRIAAVKAGREGGGVSAIEQQLESARKLAHECLEFELVVGRRYGTQI